MDKATECVKKLNFDENRENNEAESRNNENENKHPNLIQRSWSSIDFPRAREEHRLEYHRSHHSAQKLSQYDYSEIYKRKREEKVKKMEDEIKAQANSFKSRPMPNFMHGKSQAKPLKITVPITPKVLKRTKDTGARMKQKFSEWEAKLEATKDLDLPTSSNRAIKCEIASSYKDVVKMEPYSTNDFDE